MSDYSDSDDFAGVAGCADCGPVARQPLFGGYARRYGREHWRLAAVGNSIAEVAELLRNRVPAYEHEHTIRIAGDVPHPLAPPG